MKKKELIDELEDVVEEMMGIDCKDMWDRGYIKAAKEILVKINQLDEPEITEEQAWEVIGEAYADSEKGRLMNAKKIFDNGLKMQGIINTVVFKLNKSKDKRNFEEFVLDSIKQLKEPKNGLSEIPDFMADYIEYCKKQGWAFSKAINHNTSTVTEVNDYLHVGFNSDEHQKTFARAWFDGYTIEPPKTLQVIIRNYDSTVFKTDIPEDEAMKLIEGWKEDE